MPAARQRRSVFSDIASVLHILHPLNTKPSQNVPKDQPPDHRNLSNLDRKLSNNVVLHDQDKKIPMFNTTSLVNSSAVVTSPPTFITLMPDANSLPSENVSLLYEVYLSYMYEGDMNEEHYWQALLQTSTPQLVTLHGTLVSTIYHYYNAREN